MSDELLQSIGQLCAGDKAQCGRYAHKLRHHAPALVAHIIAQEIGRKASEPMPPVAELTALECTIFDNWSTTGGQRPNKGQKGYRARRYRAVLKAWKVPAQTIDFSNQKQCARFEVLLFSEDELADKVRQHRRNGRDDAAESLDTLASEGIAKDRLTGLLMTKPFGEGTVYHAGQAFLIDADMTAPTAVLLDLHAASGFELPPFDRRDAAGRSLMKNAVLQSRHSTAERLDRWRSKLAASLY